MKSKQTPKKKTKNISAIEIEHQRLLSLINSMADGVIAVDQHEKIITINGAALNILDLNSGALGKKISQVMKLKDADGEDVDVNELVSKTDRQIISRDHKLVYSEADEISIYLSIAPVYAGYSSKKDNGHVLIMRNINHEKSLEEERNEFISVVSHELRTPIAIAEGNLGNGIFVVEKTGGDEQVLDALKQAYDQVGLLSNMINDLSTLSRADRDVLELDVEPINAYELVSLLADEYRPHAEAKGLELRSHASPELATLWSGKLYVREILQNFITNSIKYTEKGFVMIEAIQAKDGVIFEVSDSGIGISKADKERVFDRFFRSEDYRTRKNNGTGLGLYVTMKLTKLIGAKISVESEIDKGSIFKIEVPNQKRTESESIRQ